MNLASNLLLDAAPITGDPDQPANPVGQGPEQFYRQAVVLDRPGEHHFFRENIILFSLIICSDNQVSSVRSCAGLAL